VKLLKKRTKQDFIQTHVYLIKNTLLLRDKIFTLYENFDFTTITKDLDFSNTKHLFWKVVTGEVSLRTGKIFSELLMNGGPVIKESNNNPKELVQKSLQLAS
jgi:hypothetical protein